MEILSTVVAVFITVCLLALAVREIVKCFE